MAAHGQTRLVDPAWVFADDFEGSRDASFWLGSGISLDYGVADTTGPDNKVMAMKYLPNSEGEGDSWSEYDFRLGVEAVQVEMSFKMYVPPDYEHIERNHKVFALWSGPYGKSNANIAVSSEAWGRSGGATPSVYVGVDGNNFGHARHADDPLIWVDNEGKWIDIHIYLELAEVEGGFGKLEIFKNGELLTGTHHPRLTKPHTGAPDAPDIIAYATKGNFIDQGTLLGWANGDPDGGFQGETVFLIDDFKIRANTVHGEVMSVEATKQAPDSDRD